MLFSTSSWAAENDPKRVVQNTISEIVQVLDRRSNKNIISHSDRLAIRDVVEGYFDYRELTKRSLGMLWDDLDETHRLRFMKVMQDLLEHSYGKRLSAYSGQKITFSKAKIANQKAVVRSKIMIGTYKASVTYYLHQTDSGWQVYDVRILGRSMVRKFYAEFKPIIAQGGQKRLLKTLKRRVAKLKLSD